MSKNTAANTNDTPGNTSNWVSRFGILEDVTERTTQAGKPYISFKLVAHSFEIFGACFDAEVITRMKAAVGNSVWMFGPIDKYHDGQKEKTSFKVFKFKDHGAPKAAASEQAPEAVGAA